MLNQFNYLFENAELEIKEFNLSSRIEMKTFNRTLPYYVVSYHKQGMSKLRVGDVTYEVHPGTVIFIPPNVEHDHYKDTSEESVFLWWHFKYEIGGVFDVLKLFQFPLLFPIKNKEKFEALFAEFMDTSLRKEIWPTIILRKAKSLELLYFLLNETVDDCKQTTLFTQQNQNFMSILIRMIQNIDKEISLKQLSEELFLHPTYISNRFKELFGKSPIQIHREMRINQAKKLLKTSDMSIALISDSLGFSGVSSFSRLFNLYVGVSPTEFRALGKKRGVSK
ncbi:helix-turn-helix domain-containing protein [Neobacillus bataviensis]|uniref:helix-turn-helix domain-containing protein n=1 Tax=Neobacillus bataviensis TaxID=220685 RepID=UPI001CC19E24|nr:AraC family transcriptional regulator [Neobacillus bataviensis]